MSSLMKMSICISRNSFLFSTKRCFKNIVCLSSVYQQPLNFSFRLYSKNNKSEKNDQPNIQSGYKIENIDSGSGLNLGKYKVFKDSDSPIVLDVEEERWLIQNNEDESLPAIDPQFEGINLNRGVSGVFDIEDLVDVLRKDNAQDIFVASLPDSAKYVDYIVVVTGKSYRHMLGLAEFIRRVYKKKRLPTDLIPRIEGEKSNDWIALDLGNIALHIFSEGARTVYDLESLWSLGAEYDLHLNAPEDPLIALLQKHAVSLDDLKPADSLR